MISKDSDQTAQMHRLISVFACHISLTVEFVVHWLILIFAASDLGLHSDLSVQILILTSK